jgi:hypothetical protein
MSLDPSDSMLAVRFYQREVENEFLTQQNQRPIKYMADFIRIEVPGNMLSIIDTFASDEHKRRFPVQWAHYTNERSTTEVQGTSLADWSLLTRAQASELRHFKFYTVEQVANASDQQINQVGMIVGMSGFAFRDRAKLFLTKASDNADAVRHVEEVAKRDAEIAELREQMRQLLEAQKRPVGRPKKEVEEA